MTINSDCSGSWNTRFSDIYRLGLSPIPVLPKDKKPAIQWKVLQTERASVEQIKVWDASSFNVGIATGRLSNVIVFDTDNVEAEQFMANLDLPVTAKSKTAKGYHWMFAHPGFAVRNHVRLEKYKLDVRGDGGFIVAPPSIHPDGSIYQWVNHPMDVGFAQAPADLLALLETGGAGNSLILANDAAAPSEFQDGGLGQWLSRQLYMACRELSEAPEGQRNNTLNAVAFRLAQDVAGCRLAWEPFSAALYNGAVAIGLPSDEARATLESAWKGGVAAPSLWPQTALDYVYVAGTDEFVHLPSGEPLRKQPFNTVFSGDRPQGIGKTTMASFLTDNQIIRMAQNFRYDPGKPAGIYDHNGRPYVNSYRPSDVEPLSGDPSPFEDFLAYLVPDQAEREHLVKYIAWTVRYPARKLQHAILMKGAQGTGKTTLSHIWAKLVGEWNFRPTTSEEMNSGWHYFLEGKILVVLEEMNLGAGLTVYNKLKDLITGPTVSVNKKGKDIREVPNFTNLVCFSNLPNPILIENDDRRFFVIDSPAVRREAAYYREFNTWWKENIGVVMSFFQSVDLDDFDPMAPPPVTEAKERLKAASRAPLEQELAHMMEDGEGPFARDVGTLLEVKTALDRSTRYTDLAIRQALSSLGSQKLRQIRGTGRWDHTCPFSIWIPDAKAKPSLWAFKNADHWKLEDDESLRKEHSRH
ncbi:Bifunctional DNA primase/polymerase [Sphingobium chlorophenolicum L-1]|uniref:Bifunctional DNA primase/polymerase n=2 Tax=Sphingobium chlorophenolicum TaxID=46429 RepID=F6EVA6_SPHCR|nr:Bifunctional DNA primase/polymerase [Sphingobium chlorophenolicum L-1]